MLIIFLFDMKPSDVGYSALTKELRLILKVLSLRLMIEQELLNIRILLVNVYCIYCYKTRD